MADEEKMTLVERLQDDSYSALFALRMEAADRIEALETALWEIVNEPQPEQASLWSAAWEYRKDIARLALEGK